MGILFARIASIAIANAEALTTIHELRTQLELERDYLIEERERFDHDLVGHSAPMETVKRQIDMVAPTDATVLITGESGTGSWSPPPFTAPASAPKGHWCA